MWTGFRGLRLMSMVCLSICYVGFSKVKLKLSLGLTKYHAMKMYLVLNQAPHHEDVWVNRGIAPCILNFSTRQVNGQLHALIASPPMKDCWYPLGRRLGGP